MDNSFKALFNGMRHDYIEWDDYFMAIAKLSSYRSKDPCTQVGAVLVNEFNRIIGIGYNGFPHPCKDEVFPWYKQRKMEDGTNCIVIDEETGSQIPINDPVHDKKYFVVHAEANAILNSNSANLKNTRLYTTLYPCSECAKLILQSGIKKIYYMYHTHADRAEYRASAYMFTAANIECVQYKAQMDRIIIDLSTKPSDMKNGNVNNKDLSQSSFTSDINGKEDGSPCSRKNTKQTNPFLPNYNHT